MSITNNQCPSGLVNMRRAFPVDPATITDGSRKGQKVATCPVCDHPSVPVIKQGGGYVFTGHVESLKAGGVTESGRSYSKKRERGW